MSADPIRVLPNGLIDQIKAGEVVERPASVAKELLENACDAGATDIEVELENGGLTFLRVSDNGCGMSPQGARTSLLRHATSKISTLEDLGCITSLGFRGEALSSIASVSQLTLTTRRAKDSAATTLEVDAGRIVASRVEGAPVGTTIQIRNLFFNTPARQKFMRSPATEQAHTLDWIQRVMLGAPKISAVVSQKGRRLLDVTKSSGAQRLEEMFSARLGRLFAGRAASSNLNAHGWVIADDPRRVSRLGLWLFVNGRFIKNRMLSRAIAEGLGRARPDASPPHGFFFLSLDPSTCDLNVHPQKLEIRLGAPLEVVEVLTAAACEARRAAELEGVYLASEDVHRVSVNSAESGTLAPAQRGRGPAVGRAQTPDAKLPKNFTDDDVNEATSAVLKIRPSAGKQSAPSVWEQLMPLGIAPAGYVACRLGEWLICVSVVEARRAVLQKSISASGEVGLKARMLPLPCLYTPKGRQLGLAEDYLIDFPDGKSVWALALEPVGPGRFVITSAVDGLAGIEPVAQMNALLDAIGQVGLSARDAWQHRQSDIRELWMQRLVEAHELEPAESGANDFAQLRLWLSSLGAAGIDFSPPQIRCLSAQLQIVDPQMVVMQTRSSSIS